MSSEQRALGVRSVLIGIPNHRCRIRVADVVGESVSGTVGAARGDHIDCAGGDLHRGKIPTESNVLSNTIVGC